jgi:hypothetical protein
MYGYFLRSTSDVENVEKETIRIPRKTWMHGLYMMYLMNPWREARGEMHRVHRMPSLVGK